MCLGQVCISSSSIPFVSRTFDWTKKNDSNAKNANSPYRNHSPTERVSGGNASVTVKFAIQFAAVLMPSARRACCWGTSRPASPT